MWGHLQADACAHGSYYTGLAVKGTWLTLCGPILAYTGLLPPFRGLISGQRRLLGF